MKYVIVTAEWSEGIGKTLPVIFPEHLTHAHMAHAVMWAARKEWPKANVKVHSAGFCEPDVDGVRSGSETLNIKQSIERDSQDATLIFGHQYTMTLPEAVE